MDSAARPANKWLTFALVAIGVFMATLDSSIVNVSLPAIARSFGLPLGAAVEWVVISYLVSVAALLLSVGRLADLLGRRRIWLVGLAVFTAASMLCGVAPNMGSLIAARAVQGIGGACLMAISPAMLTAAFPKEQRGRAIGLNAVVVALGISTGPTLGGVITEQLSFRYIFYLNVPIGIVGWALAHLHLPASGHRAAEARFDPLGALYLALFLAGLTAGLTLGNELGWQSPIPIGLLVVAAVSGRLFFSHGRSHAQPVVDFTLFQSRAFSVACVSLMLSFAASFAVGLILPFYFEELRGFDTAQTGLLLTPFPLTIAIIAPISGAAADRIGTRGLAASGMTILAVGLCSLAQLDAQSSRASIIARLMLAGTGQALFQSPNNSALLGAAPREKQGLASGMLATGRVMGQSLSVAASGALFGALGGADAGRSLLLQGANRQLLEQTFLHAYRYTFYMLAVIALAAAVTALAARPRSAA